MIDKDREGGCRDNSRQSLRPASLLIFLTQLTIDK